MAICPICGTDANHFYIKHGVIEGCEECFLSEYEEVDADDYTAYLIEEDHINQMEQEALDREINLL